MTEIRKIERNLKAVYAHAIEPAISIPLELQALQWAQMAEDFSAAATVISEQSPYNWLPRLQLTGHAIEAALKGCLAANAISPPNTHDLVRLYELAENNGYTLNEPGMACIVHASHFFFRDLGTGTKHKARYPTANTEMVGGAVPANAMFQSIVRSLVEQARAKRPW